MFWGIDGSTLNLIYYQGDRFMPNEDPVISHGGLHPNHTEEMKYFKEKKVYTVQIESTSACPQSCLYCYASQKGVPINELSKKNVITVLDSASNLEVKAIDWLGGDPLVRDDWYELMIYAKDLGLRNNIWTSGIPLKNMEVAKKAVEVTDSGFISVHLDSLNETNYSKVHSGEPRDIIEAILTGVDNALAFGKSPKELINCITYTKPLAGSDVNRTIKYFFEEKGIRTCLTLMCNVGLATEHNDWQPSASDIKDACEFRDDVNYSNSPHSISTMDVNKFYCGGIICVTVDGDVTSCSVIRKGFGNINHSPLEEIVEQYKNELLFIPLRDEKYMLDSCSNCENSSVCWGCRAMAYYETGDMMAEDPKCWINPGTNFR
jgi:radical SAM protein with 4Fe4S-binding SPASM domain